MARLRLRRRYGAACPPCRGHRLALRGRSRVARRRLRRSKPRWRSCAFRLRVSLCFAAAPYDLVKPLPPCCNSICNLTSIC